MFDTIGTASSFRKFQMEFRSDGVQMEFRWSLVPYRFRGIEVFTVTAFFPLVGRRSHTQYGLAVSTICSEHASMMQFSSQRLRGLGQTVPLHFGVMRCSLPSPFQKTAALHKTPTKPATLAIPPHSPEPLRAENVSRGARFWRVHGAA